jgi:hypothetical protein
VSSETGAHQELLLDILASEALWPSEEAEALNDESGNLCLSSNVRPPKILK